MSGIIFNQYGYDGNYNFNNIVEERIVEKKVEEENVLSIQSKIINCYENLKIILNELEKAPSISDFPSFQYPNENYKEIPLSKDGKVVIVGYGSLMKKCSKDINENQTIKTENSDIRPVIAFGAKRIYNYKECMDLEQSKYPHEENELAYLNLISSSEQGSFVNGAAMKIDITDLESTIKRERGYDLEPIVFVDWKNVFILGTDVEYEIGYTFKASSDKRISVTNPDEMIHYTDDNILPMRDYEDYVKSAVDDVGPLFSEMYDETTYLADGKTHVYEWDRTVTEKNNEYVQKYENEKKQKTNN